MRNLGVLPLIEQRADDHIVEIETHFIDLQKLLDSVFQLRGVLQILPIGEFSVNHHRRFAG